MKISRRKFMTIGIGFFSIAIIPKFSDEFSKNELFSNNIEKFFSNFFNIILVKPISNIKKEIFLFEKKILIMISKKGINETLNTINSNIKTDYQLGKIKLIEGWVVSETELKILVLRNKKNV